MKSDSNPFYIIVIETAKKAVAETGKFLKHTVLVDDGFGAYEHKVSASLQWPLVREAIERESGRMIPIAAEGNEEWNPDIHPEKFLPGGQRKTIGYALASAVSPSIATAYVQRKVNSLMGVSRHTDAVVTSFQQQGLPITYTPATPPTLMIGGAPAE